MREALGPVVEVLEAGRREGLAPGLAAAVRSGGRLVHASVHGDAQLEPGRRPLTPSCHFDVASLTKVMATGTLAAAMVDRGEIGLDDPAASWLPGFEQGGKAAVTLRIDSRYNQIPDDSDASIYTAGLLGGQYIGIGPGGSETYYQDGNQIHFTQSAIVLESLISKFLFSLAGKDKDKEAPTEDKAP